MILPRSSPTAGELRCAPSWIWDFAGDIHDLKIDIEPLEMTRPVRACKERPGAGARSRAIGRESVNLRPGDRMTGLVDDDAVELGSGDELQVRCDPVGYDLKDGKAMRSSRR